MAQEETLEVRVVRLEERRRADEEWRQEAGRILAAVQAGVQEINLRLASGDGKEKGRGDMVHWVVTGLLGVAQAVAIWRAH